MRWKGRRRSENVEDRRSKRGAATVGGGLFGIILVPVVIFLGGDPHPLLEQMQNIPPAQQNGLPQADAEKDELAHFVSVVLADTEEVWTDLFRGLGKPYREPILVLFRDQVRSACGIQGAATGPFYCPADQHVYIESQGDTFELPYDEL